MIKHKKIYETYVASVNIENGIYGITFFDFPGCVSVADDIEEAVHNAHEVLQLHTTGMLEDDPILPTPTDLKDIIAEEGKSDLHLLVEIKINNVKRKRISLPISKEILAKIDESSSSRTRFIEKACLSYLLRFYDRE